MLVNRNSLVFTFPAAPPGACSSAGQLAAEMLTLEEPLIE